MINTEVKVGDMYWTTDLLCTNPVKATVIGVMEEGNIKCEEELKEGSDISMVCITDKSGSYNTKEEALEVCNTLKNKEIEKLIMDINTPEKLLTMLVEAEVDDNYRDREYYLTTKVMRKVLIEKVREYFKIDIEE